QLAKLLRPEWDRPVDDPVLRGLRLRRPGHLRPQFADHLHQACPDAHPGAGRRARPGVSPAAIAGVFSRPEDAEGADEVGRLSGRGPRSEPTGTPPRHPAALGRMVRRETAALTSQSDGPVISLSVATIMVLLSRIRWDAAAAVGGRAQTAEECFRGESGSLRGLKRRCRAVLRAIALDDRRT